MTTYSYTVEEDLTVKMFNSDMPPGVPFLEQPTYPNGDAWGSAENATAWADVMVAYLTDPDTATVLPGDSAAAPTKPKPAQITD